MYFHQLGYILIYVIVFAKPSYSVSNYGENSTVWLVVNASFLMSDIRCVYYSLQTDFLQTGRILMGIFRYKYKTICICICISMKSGACPLWALVMSDNVLVCRTPNISWLWTRYMRVMMNAFGKSVLVFWYFNIICIWKIAFPTFGNGNGNDKFHSQFLGMGTGMTNSFPDFWEREWDVVIPGNDREREWEWRQKNRVKFCMLS